MPQGLCHGPLIFLVFNKDLHQVLKHSHAIVFADNTTLYKTSHSIDHIKKMPQTGSKIITRLVPCQQADPQSLKNSVYTL